MDLESKYINLRDGHFFTSDNNWEDFEYHESGSVSGNLETDNNIIAEVKIRHALGEHYGKFIISELKKIEKQFKLNHNEGYGGAFEIFAMSVLLNKDINDVYNENIVKGSNDGKVDAVEFSETSVSLYQIKTNYAPNYSTIKPTMRNNYNKYLDDRNLSGDSLSDLNDFFKANDTKIRDGLSLKTIVVSSNDEADYKPFDIYNLYINNLLLNRTNNMIIDLRADDKYGYTQISDTKQAYAYFVNAKKFLTKLLADPSIGNNVDNLKKLFYDNVRGQLTRNEDMEDTIENDCKNFVLYNNGITITGELVNVDTDTNTFTIKEPVISNGQQTLWNLIEYKDTEYLSKINLLIIIKNTKRSSLVKSSISRFTNTQTNIKPIDLFSLSDSVRKLQEAISYTTYKRVRYFIDINTSGSRGYERKTPKMFSKFNIIKLADFCKLYYCTEDKKVGSWKNKISPMLKEKLKNIKMFDIDKSLKICEIISNYNKYLDDIMDKKEKDKIACSGLAMMYISYAYGYDLDRSKEVIDKINSKYFDNAKNKPSKLINIYMSDDIINKIEEFAVERVTC